MLTWPHPHGAWGNYLEQAEQTFAAIAKEVTRRENLLVSCYDASHQEHIQRRLVAAGVDLERVRLETVPSNDVWARDHGPITVLRDHGPVILDFTFNGWGNKYEHQLDNDVTVRLGTLGAFGNVAIEKVNLILEGGGIETDGAGTLLTSSHCQLSPSRNAGLDREKLEGRFKELFGVERVLWLEHGQLAGDDTDGHIDTLARFCDPSTIAYVSCDDPEDEHFDDLRAMAEELQSFRDLSGHPYRLVPLPLPKAHHSADGERLPATYANFLIINGAVLVPTYNDPLDPVVLERLQDCFPNREVIGIDCSPLIRQYGSLHCVTMQLPAGVLRIA